MRKSQMTNKQILNAFLWGTVRAMKHPNNKADEKEWNSILTEIGKRLGLTDEEIDEIRDSF